jgi:uncharacterized protein YggE
MEIIKVILGVIFLGVILLAGAFFFPWQKINWGRLSLAPSETVTVIGTAKSQQKSQIATFTAGVNVTQDNKQEAIDEVNQKIKAVTDAVKEFGVKDEDIKTQNLNVYQREETYYEEGVQKVRQGQWSVSNTVEIKLRDANRASSLATLLSKSGANNVYGPNFSVDDTTQAENALLEEALNNAHTKADILATAGGKKLGKILSVSEGAQQGGVFPALEKGGGGGGLEPGSETIQKSVTVTFELE